MKSKLKQISIYVFTAIFILGGVALADKLIPGGNTSTPTMYTLEDIYKKTQDLTYTITSDSHDISTTTAPDAVNGTMNTLSTIFEALGNIVIPSTTDVRLGTTYGPNNSLTGEMSLALEWGSSDYGPVFWSDAVAICQSYDYNGTGWSLPTISQLLSGLSDQFLLGDNIGFAAGVNYWSNSNLVDNNYAYIGYVSNDLVNSSYEVKINSVSVRCVR